MQHIGQYPVVEELGAGAMGQVFKVQGSEPGEFYALKLLKNLNAEQIQRFQREAKILQFLGRQPNIIGFHDMGADHGRPYIVMEFIRGARTLEELINRRESSRRAYETSEIWLVLLAQPWHVFVFCAEKMRAGGGAEEEKRVNEPCTYAAEWRQVSRVDEDRTVSN